MQIKINPFPVIYYAVICEKHECRVEIRARETEHPQTTWSSHGQLISMSCEKAGPVRQTDCMDQWVMTISGSGEVRVTN
jgi:hypothetical protein